MADVDYKLWVEYIEQIFSANGIKHSLVLDLACGTGSVCTEMSKKGYEMIGIDISEDMLACAKNKAVANDCDILYIEQDITKFELYGTVNAILCLMDSINYITNKKSLLRLFKLIDNYLEPDGIFIFDINTKYKLEKVLGNEVFYETNDNLAYIWQNSYNKKKGICSFDLTFFVKEGDKYDRYDEFHEERAYTVQELKTIISKTGLKVINIFDELSLNAPNVKSNRIFFICKKNIS